MYCIVNYVLSPESFVQVVIRVNIDKLRAEMSFDKLANQVTTRRLASAAKVIFHGLISVLLLVLAGFILYLGILSPVFRPTPRLVFDLPTIESKQDYTLDLLVQED